MELPANQREIIKWDIFINTTKVEQIRRIDTMESSDTLVEANVY